MIRSKSRRTGVHPFRNTHTKLLWSVFITAALACLSGDVALLASKALQHDVQTVRIYAALITVAVLGYFALNPPRNRL